MTKFVVGAMPPLPDSSCGSVEIYVTVSRTKDVEFVRISKPSNSIARSGKISPDLVFPHWASRFFASVQVQRERLVSKTLVSTKWPVDDILQAGKDAESKIDASWSLE